MGFRKNIITILLLLSFSVAFSQENSSDLQRTIGQAQLKYQNSKSSPIIQAPALGKTVRDQISRLTTDKEILARVKADPTFRALHTQTLNHLQHVSFEFKTESKDYTHDLVLKGPYPVEPTIKALQKTAEFYDILATKPGTIKPTVTKPAVTESLAKAQDRALVDKLTSDTWNTYQDMRDRLKKGGADASFPEFKGMAAQLELKFNSPQIIEASKNNPTVAAMREKALSQLQDVQKGGSFPYKSSLEAFERSVEFFDVYERGKNPSASPELYHSGRYEYYNHYLKAQAPNHLIIPTMSELSMVDLLKVRGVPIGLAGVNTETIRVDGHNQTPYEFYMHDINHSRRMLQFSKEQAAVDGISEQEFYRRSNEYVKSTLIPAVDILPGDSKEIRDKKVLQTAILFEILHEDALPPKKEVIEKAVMRPAGHRTPFEMIQGNTVKYVMEPGATTLAYTFRKLAHTFYDSPEKRDSSLLDDSKRTRTGVADAAEGLFEKLGMEKIPKSIIQSYTNTDAGFPDAFKKELVDDIKNRGNTGKIIPLNEKPIGSTNSQEFLDGFLNHPSDVETLKKAAAQYFSKSPDKQDKMHLMLMEGSELSFKNFIKNLLANSSQKQILVQLGIGYEPIDSNSDKGVRGASFFAKFLAQNPELIELMEKRGIKIMAMDAKSSRHYSSITEYFKSNDWKTQLIKFKNATIENDGKDHKDKKLKIGALEDSLKNEADLEKKKRIAGQLDKIRGEISLVESRVQSESLISKYIADFARVPGPKYDKILLDKMTKASSSADIATIKRSGTTVDPAEAAKAAAKGVK